MNLFDIYIFEKILKKLFLIIFLTLSSLWLNWINSYIHYYEQNNFYISSKMKLQILIYDESDI